MRKLAFSLVGILAVIQVALCIGQSQQVLAQEWKVGGPRGTLKVVHMRAQSPSLAQNYAEALVALDKDSNWVPSLAEDWRWIDDRTIVFRLRRGVRFHNGEKFNAEALRVNWEEYIRMENPRPIKFVMFPDETAFEIIDEYTVRFTFPESDGLALVKFSWFLQFAPAFFKEHKFDEKNHGYLPVSGPWGTGPFKLVEGHAMWVRPSDRVVLEAYEDYWDRRYPKVKRVVFDNTLIGNRKEAMRLCREEEGAVDIVSHIRPLDTLKVAESPFAKVVKSKDITWFGGAFNLRKRDSNWRDIRLRKALNYGVNREELLKYAARGNAWNLGGLIPSGVSGHNPDLVPYTYDTDKARSLLAEAGHPEGFEVNIISTEGSKLEAQIICRMLERIGLKVRLDVLSWPEWLRKRYIPVLDKPFEDQEWDIALDTAPDVFGHIAASFLGWQTDDSDWRSIEYDPVLEEIWKDMASTADPKMHEEKIRKLARYFYDHIHSVTIYYPLTLYAVNKEVNFVPYRSGFFRLKETSVTDNHWSVRQENQ
jgi:peptide/nickel transport system substrate-binding protein